MTETVDRRVGGLFREGGFACTVLFMAVPDPVLSKNAAPTDQNATQPTLLLTKQIKNGLF